jgi:hypothetical protein
MGTKVLSNQRVTVLAGLSSGIADWTAPSLSSLTALTNVSGAVNWAGFDLNIQASEQDDDRTLTDGAGAQSRGFTNFGGGLQFVNPKVTDLVSIFRTTYNIFSTPRVELVVAVRYGKKNSVAPAAGDKWTIYRVMSDAISFGSGDVSVYYTTNLIARDDILPNYIVPSSTPTAVAVTALSAAPTVGQLVFASAVYEGSDVTKTAVWTSSDEAKMILVHPGIFLTLATGTPGVVAAYAGGTDSTAVTITIG